MEPEDWKIRAEIAERSWKAASRDLINAEAACINEGKLADKLGNALRMALDDHSNPEWPRIASNAVAEWESLRSWQSI